MKYLKPVLILILMSLWACQSERKLDISGTYKFYNYSFLERLKYKMQKIKMTTGTILNIKPDSSYVLTTCGALESGKWTTKNDSLVLLCHKRQARKKELSRIKYPYLFNCPNPPKTYKINSNKLIRIFKFDSIKLVTILKKDR